MLIIDLSIIIKATNINEKSKQAIARYSPKVLKYTAGKVPELNVDMNGTMKIKARRNK